MVRQGERALSITVMVGSVSGGPPTTEDAHAPAGRCPGRELGGIEWIDEERRTRAKPNAKLPRFDLGTQNARRKGQIPCTL